MKKITDKRLPRLEPQYVLDKSGKKVSVLIDIKRFTDFMEEVEDLYLGAQAKQVLSEDSGERVTHDEVKKMLGSE